MPRSCRPFLARWKVYFAKPKDERDLFDLIEMWTGYY